MGPDDLSFVAVSVTDDGCGMDADVAHQAFDPFFTTKGPGRGTGLGLAMVRAFAEECGAGLDLRTAPGEGTSIRLIFR